MRSFKQVEMVLLAGGIIALIAVQLVFQKPPFGDEKIYLGNVALLHQYGFGKEYLVQLEGSAGPLYSMVHFLFEPVTHLQSPAVRWVNVMLLIGVIFFLYRTLRIIHFSNRQFALYIMAVPITYTLSGIAFTEMPALFFFCAAVYLVIKSMWQNDRRIKQVIQLIAGGCCMGLAIIGRQPMLLTLAAFPFLFIQKDNYTKGIPLLILTLVVSLALPFYVFSVWNGFVPVIESRLYQELTNRGRSFLLPSFLLCLFYLAVGMWLIAPRFYYMPAKRKIVIGMVAFFIIVAIINFIFRWIELLPLTALMERTFSAGITQAIANLCGSAVIFSGLLFLVCLYRQAKQLQFRKEIMFSSAVIVLIAVACIKITWGFSSRYPGQAMPALILLAGFFYRPSAYNILRIVLGMIIGLVSVAFYFISN